MCVFCRHAEQLPETIPNGGAEADAAQTPGFRHVQWGNWPVSSLSATHTRYKATWLGIIAYCSCYYCVMHSSDMFPSHFSQSVSLRLCVWIPALPSPPKSSWCFEFSCCGSRRSISRPSGQSWSQSWCAPCPLSTRLFSNTSWTQKLFNILIFYHWLSLFFSLLFKIRIFTRLEKTLLLDKDVSK